MMRLVMGIIETASLGMRLHGVAERYAGDPPLMRAPVPHQLHTHRGWVAEAPPAETQGEIVAA